MIYKLLVLLILIAVHVNKYNVTVRTLPTFLQIFCMFILLLNNIQKIHLGKIAYSLCIFCHCKCWTKEYIYVLRKNDRRCLGDETAKAF